MIDTHAHLQNPRYKEDLRQVIERAAEAGINVMIVPGTDIATSEAAIAIASNHSRTDCAIYAAVGVHPTSAHELTDAALSRLGELADHPRVVAIGEIGLDYYWPRVEDRGWHCAAPTVQRAALQQQLSLAAEMDLPVIIHDRDAHSEVLDILDEWQRSSCRARGTLHAYDGGTVHLARVLDLGFHIGVDGPVTFRKSTALQAVARQVPLDRLLLETDAPYLTPSPHRGKRNEPAYIQYVAARIAALRAVTVQQISAATDQNARCLFGLAS